MPPPLPSAVYPLHYIKVATTPLSALAQAIPLQHFKQQQQQEQEQSQKSSTTPLSLLKVKHIRVVLCHGFLSQGMGFNTFVREWKKHFDKINRQNISDYCRELQSLEVKGGGGEKGSEAAAGAVKTRENPPDCIITDNNNNNNNKKQYYFHDVEFVSLDARNHGSSPHAPTHTLADLYTDLKYFLAESERERERGKQQKQTKRETEEENNNNNNNNNNNEHPSQDSSSNDKANNNNNNNNPQVVSAAAAEAEEEDDIIIALGHSMGSQTWARYFFEEYRPNDKMRNNNNIHHNNDIHNQSQEQEQEHKQINQQEQQETEEEKARKKNGNEKENEDQQLLIDSLNSRIKCFIALDMPPVTANDMPRNLTAELIDILDKMGQMQMSHIHDLRGAYAEFERLGITDVRMRGLCSTSMVFRNSNNNNNSNKPPQRVASWKINLPVLLHSIQEGELFFPPHYFDGKTENNNNNNKAQENNVNDNGKNSNENEKNNSSSNTNNQKKKLPSASPNDYNMYIPTLSIMGGDSPMIQFRGVWENYVKGGGGGGETTDKNDVCDSSSPACSFSSSISSACGVSETSAVSSDTHDTSPLHSPLTLPSYNNNNGARKDDCGNNNNNNNEEEASAGAVPLLEESIIEGATHTVYFDKPKECVRLIDSFLRKHRIIE